MTCTALQCEQIVCDLSAVLVCPPCRSWVIGGPTTTIRLALAEQKCVWGGGGVSMCMWERDGERSGGRKGERAIASGLPQTTKMKVDYGYVRDAG